MQVGEVGGGGKNLKEKKKKILTDALHNFIEGSGGNIYLSKLENE